MQATTTAPRQDGSFQGAHHDEGVGNRKRARCDRDRGQSDGGGAVDVAQHTAALALACAKVGVYRRDTFGALTT